MEKDKMEKNIYCKVRMMNRCLSYNLGLPKASVAAGFPHAHTPHPPADLQPGSAQQRGKEHNMLIQGAVALYCWKVACWHAHT